MGSQAWTLVTVGTDLDLGVAMRLLVVLAAFLLWPLAVVGSLRARRRLRAHALPAGDGRLTLQRVA